MNVLRRPLLGYLARHCQADACRELVRHARRRCVSSSASLCQSHHAVALPLREDVSHLQNHQIVHEAKTGEVKKQLGIKRLQIKRRDNAIDCAFKVLQARSQYAQPGQFTSFEESFAFIDDAATRIGSEECVREILQYNNVHPCTWTAWLHILETCRDWDECVAEMYRATNLLPGPSKLGREGVLASLPGRILLCCFDLIKTADQAKDAIETLSLKTKQHTTDEGSQLLITLDNVVLLELRAYHLLHLLTPLHLLHGDRVLSAGTGSRLRDYEYSVYTDLSRHIGRLKSWRDVRTRTLAMDVIHWAKRRLGSESVDHMRMRLLSISHSGEPTLAPADPTTGRRCWQECDWAIADGRPFANASMAFEILQDLHRNDRYGKPYTLALRRAMQIAASDPVKDDANKLQELVQTFLLEENRVVSAVLASAEALELLVKEGKEHEIWAVFRQLLEQDSSKELWREWSIIIRWLAGKPDCPARYVLDLAEIDGALDQDNSPLYHHPRVCSALLSGFITRGGTSGHESALQLWDTVVRNNVSIDGTCLALFCKAMVQAGHSDRAIALLSLAVKEPNTATSLVSEQERSLVETVVIDLEIFHLLMLTFIARKEPGKAFGLFEKADSHGELSPDGRTLELLLRAAYDVSHRANDASESHPTISAILSRLTKRSPNGTKINDSHWGGKAAALKAREIFLERLFAEHPELQGAPLPIDVNFEGGQLLLRTESSWFDKKGDGGSTLEEIRLTAKEKRLQRQQPTVVQRMQFNFTARTFHRYLLLLPYVEKVTWEERLLVLSWMRALDIKPEKLTLCILCIQLDEVLTPVADFIHSTGSKAQWAAGPLNLYLAEWLGEDAVPTYKDVFRVMSHTRTESGHVF